MVEITTMVMVENQKGEVCVIDRQKKYPGICFPGGHLEKFESFTECAIREIFEETGLSIKNPVLCGIIHWTKKDSDDRYIEFLFKTTEFEGEISAETDEGPVFWLKKESLFSANLSPNFEYYLPAFLSDSDKTIELFAEWTDGFDVIPKIQ